MPVDAVAALAALPLQRKCGPGPIYPIYRSRLAGAEEHPDEGTRQRS